MPRSEEIVGTAKKLNYEKLGEGQNFCLNRGG